jgi:hypothetical protein
MGREGEREGVTARAASCSCCGCGVCGCGGCGCGVELVVDPSGPGVVGVGEELSAEGDGKGDAADTGVSMDG